MPSSQPKKKARSLRAWAWSHTSRGKPRECFTQACTHTHFLADPAAVFPDQAVYHTVLQLSNPSHLPDCMHLGAQ